MKLFPIYPPPYIDPLVSSYIFWSMDPFSLPETKRVLFNFHQIQTLIPKLNFVSHLLLSILNIIRAIMQLIKRIKTFFTPA